MSELPMLLRGVTQVAVGDLVQGLVAVLAHREDVGQDLGGVELVGQAVPHRDAGVPGEGLDGLLPIAPVLDAVEGPPEHAGGVLHGLLVADLGPAGLQVGDVGPLVVGGDLERRARARGGLLEDEGDVLAGQVRPLVAAVLGRLQLGRQPQEEPQLVGGEVEFLEEAPVAKVERHDGPFLSLPASAGSASRSGPRDARRRRASSALSARTGWSTWESTCADDGKRRDALPHRFRVRLPVHAAVRRLTDR
jgi:hypothetical protein